MENLSKKSKAAVKNLVGQIFNNWLVKKFVRCHKKQSVWECECQTCSNVLEIPRTGLRGRYTKLCKCKISKRVQSIIGQRQETWEVKRFIGVVDNNSSWECECQNCGAKRIVTCAKWRIYKKKKCDCQIKCKENIIGKKFNNLTVIEERKNKDKDHKQYECYCLCGLCLKNKWIEKNYLLSGRAKNCGCLKNLKKGKTDTLSKNRTSKGYIQIYYPSHPNARKLGYVYEHTFVMSEYLGRPLHKNESCHHINGKRDDNRLENLELWIIKQPYGQRAEDLVRYAKEILETYSDYKNPVTHSISPDWFEIER